MPILDVYVEFMNQLFITESGDYLFQESPGQTVQA